MSEKIVNVIKYISLTCIFLISFYMLVISFFTTNNRNMNNEIVTDKWLIHLLVMVAVLAAGVAVIHIGRRISRSGVVVNKNIPGIVTAVVVCIMGIVWSAFIYLSGYYNLGGDPKAVYVAVQTLFDGTYSGFDVGGYCYLYTNNNGLAIYMYYLLKAGVTTMGLQYLNVIYWMLSMWLMYRIMRLLKVQSAWCALVVIVFALCVPFGMYVTYVYGVIPGIMLVLASYYCFLKWNCIVNTGVEAKYSFIYIWGSIFFMVVACVLKQNYLIMALALAICMATTFLKKRKWLVLIYCLILFVGYKVGLGTLNVALEEVTKLTVSDGIPKLSWVAMGLRWEEENWPGEFDYWPNWMYYSVDYDNDEMERLSVKQIKYRVKYYLTHKKDGVRFFFKKINSQWNEPGYECFVVQATESRWEGGNRLTKIMSGESYVRKLYEWLANEMQTLMWLGMVLYVLLCHRKTEVIWLFAGVGFVGGFMFHMVWEAASRYAITYVVLLIPYAVIGLVECVKLIDARLCRRWHNTAL